MDGYDFDDCFEPLGADDTNEPLDADDTNEPLGAEDTDEPSGDYLKQDTLQKYSKTTVALGATPDFVPLKSESSSSISQDFLSLSFSSSPPNLASTPKYSSGLGSTPGYSPLLGSTPGYSPKLPNSFNSSHNGSFQESNSTLSSTPNMENNFNHSLRSPGYRLQVSSTPDYLLPKSQRLHHTDSRPWNRKVRTWKRFEAGQWKQDSNDYQYRSENERNNPTKNSQKSYSTPSSSKEVNIRDYIHPSMWHLNPWEKLERQLNAEAKESCQVKNFATSPG